MYPDPFPQLSGISGPPPLLVPIGRKTASASPTIEFAWTGDFDKVVFDFHNLRPATDNTTLWIRTSSDGGATFDAGASDYQFTAHIFGSGVGRDSGPGDHMQFSTTAASTNALGNGADEFACGEIVLYRPFDTTRRTMMRAYGGHAILGVMLDDMSSGYRNVAGRVDAVQFLISSGNIAEGEFIATGWLPGG